jgi:hypothetical protein
MTYTSFCWFNRRGHSCSPSWVASMAPWVAAWGQAEQMVFHPMGPHTDGSYCAYLRWFQSCTSVRTRCKTHFRITAWKGLLALEVNVLFNFKSSLVEITKSLRSLHVLDLFPFGGRSQWCAPTCRRT